MKDSAVIPARQTYPAIDLVKFFMAICVVAIHTNPLVKVSNPHILAVYEAFVRMAVPFFFLASGFLLAVKMEYPYHSSPCRKRIQRQLLHIVKLYILWTIIYLPWTVHGYTSSGITFAESILPFLQGFFLCGEHAVSWMLWYLLSTTYSLLFLLWLLKKKVFPEKIVLIGFLLLLLGIGIDELMGFGGTLPGFLSFVRTVISHTFRNGRLLQGVFYLSAGMLLAHRRFSAKCSWCLLLLGFTANCLIHNSAVSQLLILVSSIGLFILILRWDLKPSPLYPALRTCSSGLYFLHMFIWTAYNKLTVNADIWGLDCFLFTTALCILLSLLYHFINRSIASVSSSMAS